jgi:hypothetical protein
MSSQPTSPRQGGPTTTTATRGIIVVGIAAFIAVMLLWQGGGSETVATADENLPPSTTSVESTETTAAAPTDTAVPPAELQAMVANGTGTKGLAGTNAEVLVAAGYTNTVAVDATQNATTTIVYFVEGFEGDAKAVAATLGLTDDRVAPMPGAPPVADLGASQVLVVLAPDAPGAEG